MYFVIQSLNVILILSAIIALVIYVVKTIAKHVRAKDERNLKLDLVFQWVQSKIQDRIIKIKVLDGGKLPEIKHEGDAGYDCYARLDAPLELKPGTVTVIPLGFCMELPKNWHADVRPRSGLAAKEHIVAQLGLIDEPYRNEVGGIISNLSKKAFTVNPGDRICQIVCKECSKYKFFPVETLSDTNRGEGFGSSGI